jgi:hypothetical protein
MTYDEFQKFMFNLPKAGGSQGGSHMPRQRVQIGEINLSIQADKFKYCSPRENGLSEYEDWEIGYPSEPIPELIEFAESDQYTDTVYGYVPTSVILEIITRLGGIKEYQLTTANQ